VTFARLSRAVLVSDAGLEVERNALLRRVDWRFLLPSARVGRTVCFGGDELARALSLVSDVVLHPSLAEAGSCDLAVAVDPDDVVLEAAWRALRPGGSLYAEWYSVRAGSLRRILRRVRASGYERPRAYFAWPSPRRAASIVWIPHDCTHARRYYLETRVRGEGVRRITSGFLRAVWTGARSVGMVRPLCVVAQRPSHYSAHDLTGPVPEIGHDSEVLGPLPAETEWLLLTRGERSINKVAAFGFAQGDVVPRLVVKLARVAESGEALEREARALRGLHGARPGGVPGVPRPLALSATRGTTALGQTVVRGHPLYSTLSRQSYEALAWKATRWLAALACGRPVVPAAAWEDRLVQTPLTRFEDMFGAVVSPELLRVARARLEQLPDLPLVPEQRDFSPWNVVMDSHGVLGILDWESAELAGLPLVDLLYFLAYLAVFRDRATGHEREVAAYTRSLDPRTATGKITARCIAWYVDAVGIPCGVVEPLRILTWIIHAPSEFIAMRADLAADPSASTLRGSRFVAFWEASIEEERSYER
jgi:hypothetical protein